MECAHRGREDPYQVLRAAAGASQREVVHDYRRGLQQAHPGARPHNPAAAARRFEALTAASDLLRDPGRRAAYDRGQPAGEPGGHLLRPRQPTLVLPRRGSPFPLGPSPGHLIWAGPVRVQPPAPPASQHGRGAAAECDGPVVILGVRPRRVWDWPW